MKEIPAGTHVTYQLQYRRCGKPHCGTCRKGNQVGHGPYWYGYWHEGLRMRSHYFGMVDPRPQHVKDAALKKLELQKVSNLP